MTAPDTDFWYAKGLADGTTHIYDSANSNYLSGRERRPPHENIPGLDICLSADERAENTAYHRGFNSGIARRRQEHYRY